MFTEEESKTLVDIDRMMSENDLNYIFIVPANLNQSDFYFSLKSTCDIEDTARFIDILLRVMYDTSVQYSSEKSSFEEWSQKVLDKIHICGAGLE